MIENTNSKIVYQGDGEVSTFAVPFPLLKNADIAATLTASDGGQSTLTKDIDYTLNIDAQGVATLKLPAAPAKGSSLCIRRIQEITQEISLVENARFPSSVIESGFDRIVMAQQNQEEAIQRAVKAPVQETPAEKQTTLPSAETRKGGVLGWDDEGDMTIYPNPKAALAAADAARQAAGHSAAQAALSENACAIARDAVENTAEECEDFRDTVISQTETVGRILEETEAIKDSAQRAVSAFADSYSFRGFCNASNAPTPNQAGDWWIISTAGTFASIDWHENDRALWLGGSWGKLPTDDVYRKERENRMQGDGNKLTLMPLELTSGYLSIPKSAAALGKLPITYCFTYTKRGSWGTNNYLFSHKCRYARSGFSPDSGVEFVIQESENRSFVRISLNSPNVDGDSFSFSQFDVLPIGTHTLCLVIEPCFKDGTTTSTNLPQKISLYVDGVQWISKVKAYGLPAEYRGTNTPMTSTIGACQYYDDAPTSDFCINAHSQDPGKIDYRTEVQLSRIAIFNFALPATASAAASTYRYSVEQYALGEPIPNRLLLGKNLMSEITPRNPFSYTIDPGTAGSCTWTGQTCTITLNSSDVQPSQYNITWLIPAYIPLSSYAYFKVTINAVPHSTFFPLEFRIQGSTATYFIQSALLLKDGVPVSSAYISTVGIAAPDEKSSGTHVYEGYIALKSNNPNSIYSFVVASNTDSGKRGWQSGASVTLNDFKVFGAMTCLDQEFPGANQMKDRSLRKLNGVVESQSPSLHKATCYTAELNWQQGDMLPKAILSSSTNVIPENCRISIHAKSSSAVTLNVTNGAASPTIWIPGKSLAANTWTELGSVFTGSASKMAIVPTSPNPFDGSIVVYVKIEPLI